MDAGSTFAEPRVVRFDDCLFYHVMEIPGIGVTRGHWDLRSQLDDFLGRLSFAEKRVAPSSVLDRSLEGRRC